MPLAPFEIEGEGANINVVRDNCEVDCGGKGRISQRDRTNPGSSCPITSRPLHKYVAASLTPSPICRIRGGEGSINVKPRRELWLPRQFSMNRTFSVGEIQLSKPTLLLLLLFFFPPSRILHSSFDNYQMCRYTLPPFFSNIVTFELELFRISWRQQLNFQLRKDS